MYTHSDINNKKSIHFMDPFTRVSRRECLSFAHTINKSYITKDFYIEWLCKLGGRDDKTNIEVIATWVNHQYDILFAKDKKQRVQRLRSRFKTTMDNWLKSYLKNGFEVV